MTFQSKIRRLVFEAQEIIREGCDEKKQERLEGYIRGLRRAMEIYNNQERYKEKYGTSDK